MKPDQAEQQTAKSIEAIQQAAPQVELSYFLQLWPDCFNHAAKQDAPCIAVIGTGVPDIYLRACGLTPIFLFGGTYCSHEQSALFFPPVSDPAVRSAAEWLMSKTPEEIAAAVISPENSDALKVQDYPADWFSHLFPQQQDPFHSEGGWAYTISEFLRCALSH